MWPYSAWVNAENRIWLVCGHDHLNHSRIDLKLPKKNAKVVKLFISTNFMLYALVLQFRINVFQVWSVDLDQMKGFMGFEDRPFEAKKVLEFKSKDLDKQRVVQFAVRSSDSNKNKLSNMSSFYIFLCSESLFISTDGHKLEKVFDTKFKSDMYQVDVDNFLVSAMENKSKFVFKSVNFHHNSYSLKDHFSQELGHNDFLMAHTLDLGQRKALLLSKSEVHDCQGFFLKIFDIDKGQLFGQTTLTDLSIIGQLKSGLSAIDNGHMYFDNDVFKLRYDVFDQGKSGFY